MTNKCILALALLGLTLTTAASANTLEIIGRIHDVSCSITPMAVDLGKLDPITIGNGFANPYLNQSLHWGEGCQPGQHVLVNLNNEDPFYNLEHRTVPDNTLRLVGFADPAFNNIVPALTVSAPGDPLPSLNITWFMPDENIDATDALRATMNLVTTSL